jgi:predicted Zn finger-like uncharacterized protein
MYTIFLKRERKMFVICPKCAAKYQIPAEIALKEGQKVQCSACQHVFHFEKKQTIEENESVFDAPQIPNDPILKETEVVIKTEKVITQTTLPEVFHPLKPMEQKKSQSWTLTLILAVVLLVLIVAFWLYRDSLNSDINKSDIQTNRIFESKEEIQRIDQTAESEKISTDLSETEIPVFVTESELEEKNQETKQFDVSSPFSFSSIQFRYQTSPEGKQLLIEGKIHNDTDVSQILPGVAYAKAYNQYGNILFQKEIYFSKELMAPFAQKSFYSTYMPAPDGIQWMEVSCEK